MPETAPPHEIPLIQELAGAEDRPPYPFWDNFEYRPVVVDPA